MGGYTINDLLSSVNLPGLRMVAAGGHAGREIRNVNTIDNPDSYDWLRAGDFLLTTGYLFRENPGQLMGLVERLAEINCAGLGFKVMRYFDTVPAPMREAAERLGVPIVEIPLRFSLADVANEINASLGLKEEAPLAQYLRIHNSFNECSLTGGGMYGLISTLYDFVQNPVVLLDSRRRLLTHCDPEGLLDGLPHKGPKLALPPSFLAILPEKVPGKSKIITRAYPDAQGCLVARVAILEDEKSLYGYVIVFELHRQLDYFDFIALESASIPLVLERVKAKQLNEVRHQLRQDFFDDLLTGKIESVNAASSLAEIHHMDTKNTYLCLVTKLRKNEEMPGSGEDQRNNYLRLKQGIILLLDELAAKQAMNIVSIHRSNLIISFIHVPDRQKGLRVRGFLGDFPGEASDQLRAQFDQEFAIGVGTPISDYLNIRKSYIQACEAIRYSNAPDNGVVCYYEDFMVDQLLDCIADRGALESFSRLALGPLIDHDRDHGTNLLETLEVFFECNGNMSIAAKKLFLHRNSLIYRVDKIKEILDTDLKNPTTLLTLQVGFRVLRILGAE